MVDVEDRFDEYAKKKFQGFEILTGGFPDRILFKDSKLIFVEIKSVNDNLRPNQRKTLHALQTAGFNVILAKENKNREFAFKKIRPQIEICKHKAVGIRFTKENDAYICELKQRRNYPSLNFTINKIIEETKASQE